MTRRELYATVLARFREAMPVAETELTYTTPFSLLVAVMLSAQCTDKRVNLVTPALLAAYPDAYAMAAATPADLLPFVRSVSYPNSKATHLAGMARMLVEEYGGEVPDTLEALTRLPGVGRKTANVMMAVHWNRPTMPVDTHVFRVSHRIGLVPATATTPLSVEQILVRHIPEGDIPTVHHQLILHGRYVCTARTPHCNQCFLADICKEHHHPSKPKNV